MTLHFNRAALVFFCLTFSAGAEENRWWPAQAMPQAVVRSTYQSAFPSPRASYEMLVQSVAGLSAKGVNEGRCDELVWVGIDDNVDIEDWFARMLKRHPELQSRGTFGPWELVDRYAKRGLIKGYILYRPDTSRGETSQHRTGLDCSVNVATSLAGVLDGVIVDEKLEVEARSHGLKLLLDARDKTQAWCFETYKEQFNRKMLCTQDPRKPNVRDFAIAQKAFVAFGYAEPVPTLMKWLEPLSPILGWNGGDEFKTTEMSTVWGHLQSDTDWAMNLPVLMAGTQQGGHSKARTFDPRQIDWKDARSAVSFVSTDGDNVDFFEGDFFRAHFSTNYWANPERGEFPFGWSCCFAQLAQLCPEAIDYAVETQSQSDSLLEWGGGYYYPDHFASRRPDRWELLARHAHRTWNLMKQNNTRVIGFNVSKFNSADALKAYGVIARQTDGLLAILVFQYDAYEAGAGERFWVKDAKGIDIPVISARYSIWNGLNDRPRAGTPAKVAREISQTVKNASTASQPRYDWVMVHAWSWFRHIPGNDENGEDMPSLPREAAAAKGGQSIYGPARWCAERLPANVRSVSPEELIWRIRMKHKPEQTKICIQQWGQ